MHSCWVWISILLPFASAVTVHGDGVEYEGVHNETTGVNSFFGIRYAQAPVEDLRWRPPVPVDYDSESDIVIIDATERGPSCIQSIPTWSGFGGGGGRRGPSGDEDCLLLNIQTPAEPASDKLAVLVNIHGGGYTAGDASAPGDALVDQSNGTLIFVSIQYRLGPLGFLAGDEVLKDGTANAGLLDQRAALEWIRENIHFFGGDAEKVTVTGGSAGGGSVTLQMIMYGGVEDPPFWAIIPEFPWWTPTYESSFLNTQYNLFIGAANCSSLKCLRSLPVSAIEAATRSSFDTAFALKQYAFGVFYWGPAIDGDIIRAHPHEEFRDGNFAKVPMLTDRNFDEGFIFSNVSLQNEEEVVEDLLALWPSSDGDYVDIMLRLYPTEVFNTSHLENLNAGTRFFTRNASLSDAFVRRSAIFGDALVICPSSYIAEAVADAGLPVFKLVFNAGSQLHGATGAFLFSEDIGAAAQDDLGKMLRQFFISFAIYGDPNQLTLDVPFWPRYESRDPRVFHFATDEQRVIADPDVHERCRFLRMGRGNNRGIWPQW